jgi:tetratricopeptide (TPR) repeat protein
MKVMVSADNNTDSHIDSSANPELLLLRAVLLAIGALALVCSFNPQWHVWGLDYLRFFPVWLRVSLITLLVVSVIPRVSRYLGNYLLRIVDGYSSSRLDILSLSAIGFLTILFVLFSNNNQVLGDGFHLLEKLGGGPIASFEPMEHLMREGIFAVLGRSEFVILWSYRITAYLAGLLLLFGLRGLTAKRVNFLLACACLLTFGVAQFFFGYVERYAFAFVFISLYLVSAHNDLDKGRISWKTAVFILLATSMHLASGAVLPSFIYLIHHRYRSWKTTGTAFAILTATFAAAIVYASDFRSLSMILLPPLPVAGNPYGIFTIRHLLDLTNVALLGYPLIFVAVPLLLFGRIKHKGLYLIALTGTLTFVVTIDPLLTAIRDWDLLSFCAAPVFAIMVAFLRKWYRLDSIHAAALIPPLLLFALLHTGSFVWQNHENPRAAWDYFKRVVLDDPHLSVEYRKAGQFTNWKQTVLAVMADTAEDKRIIEKWSKILTLPAARDDILGNRILLMKMWGEVREWKKAVSVLDGFEQDLLPNADLVEAYGYALNEAGYPDRMGRLYKQYVQRGGRSPRILFLLGRYEFQKGNIAAAWEYFNRSFSEDPEAPDDMRLNFAVLSWFTNHVPEAVSNLRMLQGRMSPAVNAQIDEALKAVQQGNTARADSLFRLLKVPPPAQPSH